MSELAFIENVYSGKKKQNITSDVINYSQISQSK